MSRLVCVHAGPAGIPANTVADVAIGRAARSALEDAGIEVQWRKDVRNWWRIMAGYEQSLASNRTEPPGSACDECRASGRPNDGTGPTPRPRHQTIPWGGACHRPTHPTVKDRQSRGLFAGLSIGIAGACVLAGYLFFQGKIKRGEGSK
jgi:hypothetical protein